MRSGAAVASVVIAFLTLTACSPKTEPPAPAQGEQSAPVSPPPLVALPDVSAMAAPVQEQLRDRYDRLTRAKATHGTTRADLANAYGDLGRLLLAAESFADAEPCFSECGRARRKRPMELLPHTCTRLQGKSINCDVVRSHSDIPARRCGCARLAGRDYIWIRASGSAGPLFSKAAGLAPPRLAARLAWARRLAGRDYARAIAGSAALALDRRHDRALSTRDGIPRRGPDRAGRGAFEPTGRRRDRAA